MTEFKLVISTNNGKSYQKEIKDPESEHLLKSRIGDVVKGDLIGFPGYEFQITGGSDKCGFPMRKGIQQPRKKVLIGRSVGFSGKTRNNDKQGGLVRRRTVCGEMITKIIHQINVKVTKEGAQPFVSAPSEEAKQ
ncbi:TPA: 30S ribosomal protein S6e [Candidatus Woesearchaeota archaeon]|nr:30S ribosomal protein S6e [Candidatus Woesearchaeota archaeon]